MNVCRKVAIIGAGPSGLAAIKSCKEEGIEPVCYERNSDPGGLWRYHDEDIEGVASVMRTTIINTSKELSAFSDFPPPKEFPNYMHNTYMFQYFMMYAEHFDLLRHIRYNLEVVKVEPSKDHDVTGRWIVSVKSLKTEAVTKEEFDGVMVCIGHHVYPKIPTFPGQEKFQGIITHSHSVKDCKQFEDKTVVVVGIGNSGVDAAVDCTFTAKNVYLSTRRGSWIFGRVGINGRPLDVDLTSRRKNFLSKFVSYNVMCSAIERELNKRFDHEAYKLKPKHRVFSAHPTINDALPNCILSGKIVIKGDIKTFKEDGIIFQGDDEVTKVDVVILATGYLIKFPFLGDLAYTDNNNVVHLYKYCIPPSIKHGSLAIIGLIQPLGSIFPISEIQCRWVVQILKGNLKLPSREEMEKDIKAKKEANAKRYTESSRHTIQVDFLPFMDEIAELIGAKPNLLKLAITDPKLFCAIFNGPALPYQFRLQGPHAWAGARNAILTANERIYAPLNENGKTIPKSYDTGFRKTILICFAISIAGVYYANKYSYLPDIRMFPLKIPFLTSH